jgi:hypothetical protein
MDNISLGKQTARNDSTQDIAALRACATVLRSRVDEQEEPVTRPFDRRIWRGVDGHAALQQKETHAQPPPKQMKSSGVQAVINDEVCNVNNVYNTDYMLITCDNETDIFISKSTKDTIWNL